MQSKILKKVLRDAAAYDNIVVFNFDATGNIVAQPQHIQKRVYYYALTIRLYVAGDKYGFVVHLGEMVTSSHNVQSVKHFLDEFKHFMVKELKQSRLCDKIVTDMSFVNLNSISNIQYTKYIETTYKMIMDRTFIGNTLVEITLCCSHKVKNLVKDVKKYYNKGTECTEIIEIVVSLINISDYSQLIEIWTNFCVILLSKKYTLAVKRARKK